MRGFIEVTESSRKVLICIDEISYITANPSGTTIYLKVCGRDNRPIPIIASDNYDDVVRAIKESGRS